jgi:mRNA-degrading endonuclease RelE of RelBE toxin-antitoxin system
MPNKIELKFASEFKRNIRLLSKKYRRIKSDLAPLFSELEQGVTPGDQIQSVGATLYKVRVRNTDSQKGKRGGYRIVYYIKHQNQTILLAAYSKNEKDNISTELLQKLVDKYKL